MVYEGKETGPSDLYCGLEVQNIIVEIVSNLELINYTNVLENIFKKK